jgi:hypothetical protein
MGKGPESWLVRAFSLSLRYRPPGLLERGKPLIFLALLQPMLRSMACSNQAAK